MRKRPLGPKDRRGLTGFQDFDLGIHLVLQLLHFEGLVAFVIVQLG